MKSKELMIGDWVQYDASYPPMGEKKPMKLTMQGLMDIDQGKECTPIILTVGIFERNGWKVKDGLLCYIHTPTDTGIDAWLEYRGHNRTLFIGDGLIPRPITYVHELQHALRLCGLDTLADKFKI